MAHINNVMNILTESSYYEAMMNDVKEFVHIDTTEDYARERAITFVDEWSMKWDFTEAKKIVNTYGVLEILDEIKDNYGIDYDLLFENRIMPEKYRTLLYFILLPNVEKEIEEMLLENDDTEESSDTESDESDESDDDN